MLYLVFKIGTADYAIESTRVTEVVPAVVLRPCPGAPAHVAGLFNYRDSVVPVIDLVQLVAGTACPRRLSTRLILAACAGPAGATRLLALMAESITETLHAQETDFGSQGVYSAALPFLDGLRCDKTRMIQRILPERIIPPDVMAALMAQAAAVGTPAG